MSNQNIPFIGGAYEGRSKNVNSQTCINWFPVLDQEGGKPIALYNTPGLIEFTDIGVDYAIRGLCVYGALLYAVCYDKLYSINTSGTVVEVGTLDSISGHVSMATNFTQLIIVDGSYGYTYAGATLDKITDAQFPSGPDQVVFLDSYGIVNDNATGDFYWSDANDFTSWSGSYSTAESGADDLLAILADRGELWLFGENTSEIWYTSGAPFSRVSGGVLDMGIGAKWSAAKINNGIYWFNDKRQVFKATGHTPERVSTPSIEYQFSSYATVDDAIGFTFHDEGHDFYVLTFPTQSITWVYNTTTGFWHQWLYDVSPQVRHRAQNFVRFDKKNIIGDHSNGKLYQIDMDTYSDDGTTIRRERTAQVINSGNKVITYNNLTLEFEHGVGLVTGDDVDTDPDAMLSWSDDGGHSFGNELWVPIGKIGEYANVCRWDALGQAVNRVFKVAVSAKVKPILISASADVDIGD